MVKDVFRSITEELVTIFFLKNELCHSFFIDVEKLLVSLSEYVECDNYDGERIFSSTIKKHVQSHVLSNIFYLYFKNTMSTSSVT